MLNAMLVFILLYSDYNEPGPWICRSMRGQDGKRHSKANLCQWYVLKCRSARSVIPRKSLLIEGSENHTHPSVKYMSVLIELLHITTSPTVGSGAAASMRAGSVETLKMKSK